jgi:hypothetical protein
MDKGFRQTESSLPVGRRDYGNKDFKNKDTTQQSIPKTNAAGDLTCFSALVSRKTGGPSAGPIRSVCSRADLHHRALQAIDHNFVSVTNIGLDQIDVRCGFDLAIWNIEANNGNRSKIEDDPVGFLQDETIEKTYFRAFCEAKTGKEKNYRQDQCQNRLFFHIATSLRPGLEKGVSIQFKNSRRGFGV